MVNLRSYNMLLLVAIELRHALQRHIIALGRPARKDNLLALGSNSAGYLLSGQLYGVLGLPAKGVTL